MSKARPLKKLWKWSNAFAVAILGTCVITHGWFILESTPNLLNPLTLEPILKQLSITGPLIYIAVLILSVVISPIPGAPLAVVGGVVWGMPWAGVYSIIGGFLGSLLAYFIGHTLGHSAIQALTGKSIYIVNQRGDRYLGWLIFFSRLFPVLPFDLVSYAAGMTRLSVKIYAITTLLGMIPTTFLLSYAGQSLTATVPQMVTISTLLLILLVGLPWVAHRNNWLNMRDIIRVE